ncbi:MAG: hypothetical protein KDE19_03720, partial [Caldilineaceae bacterium]|nr:hypothetical protein [Caldilineaceae bacterium]
MNNVFAQLIKHTPAFSPKPYVRKVLVSDENRSWQVVTSDDILQMQSASVRCFHNRQPSVGCLA